MTNEIIKKTLASPMLQQRRNELRAAAQHMKQGIQTDEDTGLEYFTGYAYRTLYDWDQYFDAIVQIYMGWPADYIKNGVLIFLEHQQPSGLISRSVPSNEVHDPEHVKPFLCQIALLVIEVYGDSAWILQPDKLEKLHKYLTYWLVNQDFDGNGLPQWNSAPHTGMDNQHERAGYWLDGISEGVDLASYLVLELDAFAQLARLAGNSVLAGEYEARSKAMAEKARQCLWDEDDGFFYDRSCRYKEDILSPFCALGSNFGTGGDNINNARIYKPRPEHPDRIYVKYSGAFTPLFAGYATEAQAQRMVREHLLNEAEFWTPHPITSIAKCEDGYRNLQYFFDLGCNWRAATWIPVNYMIFHGLLRYGYTEEAAVLAEKSRNMVLAVGDREWYDTETGAGRGLNPFWGWSLLAHFMPVEDQVMKLPPESV